MGKNVEEELPVVVDHVSKDFRIYKDKSHTLKSRILSRRRNQYELNHVLDDISFSVKKGEAVGLIGHNGCGKSTTLKLLNRILYPDKGTITVRGRVSSLIELGAGFHPDMTGRENIYINATIFGLKKHEIDERLDDIIRFSELERYIDTPVRTYSSGMYMRLAFSIAINVDADVLLVDEILAVGDANFQKKCFTKMKDIKKRGTTIVIVSHSMDQIRSICNRAIWLEDGKIVEDEDPRIVCGDYLVSMDDRAAERHAAEMAAAGEKSEDPNVLYPLKEVYPDPDWKGRRSGNMEVRYTSVDIQDLSGAHQTEFRTGDSMRIALSVTDSLLTNKINVVVKLFNKYGGHCATFDSHYIWFKQHLDPGGDGTSVCLDVHQMQLIHGDYYLSFELYDGDGTMYDHMEHLLDFSIVPKAGDDTDNLGVIDLPFEWKQGSFRQIRTAVPWQKV